MRRWSLGGIALLVALSWTGTSARAQWMYPMGYGGYGMSKWGADPGAGYMAGLGSFARSQGVYQVEKAKADAINADTMIKWNKALRARQQVLRAEKRQEAARREAANEARLRETLLTDGTTLNNLLYQILDVDPAVVKTGRSRTPLSAAAIREIPFEWDSEAITLCLDQMTGQGSLPDALMAAKYAEERDALHAAVAPALAEDAVGTVSLATTRKINEAVAHFRAQFLKKSSEFEPGYLDALDFFTTMASLSRLLNDPSMKDFLAKLDDSQPRTVGDLIAFMHSHNLRFGPAASERQVEIYRGLAPLLTTIRDEAGSAVAAAASPDRTGKDLISSAKETFKGMSWDQLEAHARGR
jgi:hypothetical protein